MINFPKKQLPTKSNKKLNYEFYLGIPFYLMIVILVLIPIGLMLLYAFTTDANNLVSIRFTFDNFIEFFVQPTFLSSMLESVYLSLISALICLLIAYPLAFILSRRKLVTQKILVSLITSNMFINSLLLAYAVRSIFEMIGNTFFNDSRYLLGTDLAIITGMVYLYLPFMLLPIYTHMAKLDKNLFESAEDLGANKYQTITRVVIPMSLSSVLTGFMMVFLPASTTLVITRYLGDGKRKMIGDLIDLAFKSGKFGYGAAIALVLAVILLIFVYLIKKLDKYEGVLANED
ncbi:ABC transporter permease [Acholeplasma granularum]|uniref:ABC transporter permease n=1 Tax=Acholeplasma granularum TaxID=264635 RepID=UPI0004720EE7|nr:ABC transporter permease [Acholeplasma granularum]